MFDEVQFPPGISYGSKGGPGFETNIITTDSGAEQRVARRGRARYSYDVSYGVKSYADLAAVAAFYVARLGCTNGFRLKDWLDYHTGAVPSIAGTPGALDEVLTDLGSNQFQLVKRYTSGATTRVRNITKPVSGTVLVASDAATLTLGTDFTVDTTTGIVTVASPGAVITGGCAFDVPVRFGKEVDSALFMSLDDFNTGKVSSIPMMEIMDTGVQTDEYYYGGAFESAPAGNFNIALGDGKLQIYAPSADVDAALPDAATVATGGPVFYLVNADSTNTITVKSFTGTTVVSLGPGTAAELVLTVDGGGVRVWYAF